MVMWWRLPHWNWDRNFYGHDLSVYNSPWVVWSYFFAGHTVPWCLDCWGHLVSMKFLSFTHWICCPETDGVFSPASALGGVLFAAPANLLSVLLESQCSREYWRVIPSWRLASQQQSLQLYVGGLTFAVWHTWIQNVGENDTRRT